MAEVERDAVVEMQAVLCTWGVLDAAEEGRVLLAVSSWNEGICGRSVGISVIGLAVVFSCSLRSSSNVLGSPMFLLVILAPERAAWNAHVRVVLTGGNLLGSGWPWYLRVVCEAARAH